jgi:hypothetical protein
MNERDQLLKHSSEQHTHTHTHLTLETQSLVIPAICAKTGQGVVVDPKRSWSR